MYQNKEQIENEIYKILKPAMDLMSWGIENIGKEVHEWPQTPHDDESKDSNIKN